MEKEGRPGHNRQLCTATTTLLICIAGCVIENYLASLFFGPGPWAEDSRQEIRSFFTSNDTRKNKPRYYFWITWEMLAAGELIIAAGELIIALVWLAFARRDKAIAASVQLTAQESVIQAGLMGIGHAVLARGIGSLLMYMNLGDRIGWGFFAVLGLYMGGRYLWRRVAFTNARRVEKTLPPPAPPTPPAQKGGFPWLL